MAKNNQGVNPVTAGVVGAAVGAAVGIAALALSDDKNRKVVQKKFEELKEKGEAVYSEFKKTALEAKSKKIAKS